MGTSVKKPISEFPELKSRIIQNIDFLGSALLPLSKAVAGNPSPQLNIASPDSSLEIEIESSDRAVFKLRYSIDNDANAENGRLYLEDRFVIDHRSKQQNKFQYSRSVNTTTQNTYWTQLSLRIQKSRIPQKKSSQIFFEKVLRPLLSSLPSTPRSERREIENSQGRNRRSEEVSPILKNPLLGSRQIPLLIKDYGYSNQLVTLKFKGVARVEEPRKNILDRQLRVLPTALALPQDQWMASLTDPIAFVPFVVGTAAYRFTNIFILNLFGDLGFKRDIGLRLLAAALGVAAESTSFETTEHLRHGKSFDDFPQAVFESFKMFSLFHGSGHLWKQITESPFWLHLASWGTFHGVNEWQRSSQGIASDENYILRLFEDAAFYLHAGAASSFSGELIGFPPNLFLPRKISEQTKPIELESKPPHLDIGKIETAPEPVKTRILLRLVNGSMELRAEEKEAEQWSLMKRIDVSRDEMGRFSIGFKNSLFHQDLKVNTTSVKAGEKIYIRSGALIQYHGQLYSFIVQEPGLFEREFQKLAPPVQQRWTNELTEVRSIEELKGFFKKAPLGSWANELGKLEACLEGKASVDTLSPLIQSKVLEIMEVNNIILGEHLPQGFESSFEFGHPLLGASEIEQRYHFYRIATQFRQDIRNAQSTDQILEIIDQLPLMQLEGNTRQEAYKKVDEYRNGKKDLGSLPIDFGIRQRLADLEEFRFYRQHEEGLLRPSYGQDASFARNMKDLDKARDALLLLMRSGSVRASAKTYQGLDLADLVYEVLERGKPLETVPTEESTRRYVKTYMDKVIHTSMILFAPEWRRASNRNYLNGEHFGDASNEEQYLQTRYRFARMLLNEQAGLPIFGEPTQREKGILAVFAKNQLKLRGDIQYADAQAAIREQLENFSASIREGLKGADQEMRALVMETYFGSQQHRIMSDPYKAFEVARFLGEVGFYREVGVTVELSGKRMFTYLSLGDLNSVHPAQSHQYFVLHTHPQKYTNRRGEMMGPAQYSGRTMALDIGDPSLQTLSVLFSGQDVRLFVQHAKDIFVEALREPQLNLSIFYDRKNRIFKNWVQHPQGMSEMKVRLSPTGVPLSVDIEYGVKSEAQGDSQHLQQAEYLRSLAAELRLPVKVSQVNLYLLESQVPFASH